RHRRGDPRGARAGDQGADARHQATGAPLGHQLAVVAPPERHRATVRHDHHRSLGHGAEPTRPTTPRSPPGPVARRRQRRTGGATGGSSGRALGSIGHTGRVRMVAAPDKFRGTASATEVADAIGRAAWEAGWRCDEVPMADGGEGLLEALGGANRVSTVTGPLGDPVEAPWRLDRSTAVGEMALASGLTLVGGAGDNDPVAASTYGTGELVNDAVEAGARRVIVGVGGSATTDGGLGALRALYPLQRLRGVEIVVACDVSIGFVDAAERFAPQKGASPAQVELLRR